MASWTSPTGWKIPPETTMRRMSHHLPAVFLAAALLHVSGCDPRGDDDDGTPTPSDDDSAGDDDTTEGDDDDSLVTTLLTTSYGCTSEGGASGAREWYYFDPRADVEGLPENYLYADGERITRSQLGYCGIFWHWDDELDQIPAEPGWFESSIVDYVDFHGASQIVVWLPRLLPDEEVRYDLEPNATLMVRGGETEDSLGEWTEMDLTVNHEYPEEYASVVSWILPDDAPQPDWAGRFIQYRIELRAGEPAEYAQAALPLFFTYVTSVSYYYYVQNQILDY